jgi:hypothetical protein
MPWSHLGQGPSICLEGLTQENKVVAPADAAGLIILFERTGVHMAPKRLKFVAGFG